MLAGEETIEMRASEKPGHEDDASAKHVVLDVLDEANAPIYWRAAAASTPLDLGFARPGVDAL